MNAIESKRNWGLLGGLLSLFLSAPVDLEAQQRPQNGGRGPGGGDVLVCSQSEENRFDGFYSYDYVQTRRSLTSENTDEYPFPGVETCLGKLESIHYKLEKVNPILASGFREYIDSLPIQASPKPSALRRWVPISYEHGPVECLGHDIQDETAIISTPNCRRCQVFIRDFSKANSGLIYTYDARLLSELSKEPRQCSYALVHEWARDFLPNSKDLYFFTRMLHSKEFHDEGEFQMNDLPRSVADCLNHLNQQPIQSDLLGQYFAVVSQVPPTPEELENFQTDMRQRFTELQREIDDLLGTLDRQGSFGMSQGQVQALSRRVKADRDAIMASLRQGELSYAEAYASLSELRERLPNRKNPGADIEQDPYLFDQIINMESYPGFHNTFRPPAENERIAPENLQIIQPRR